MDGRREALLRYLGLSGVGGDLGDQVWFVKQGWINACKGGRVPEDDYVACPGLVPSTTPELDFDASPPPAVPADRVFEEPTEATKAALAVLSRVAHKRSGEAPELKRWST